MCSEPSPAEVRSGRYAPGSVFFDSTTNKTFVQRSYTLPPFFTRAFSTAVGSAYTLADSVAVLFLTAAARCFLTDAIGLPLR